jgi:predicted transcriptional regulator
MKLLTRDVPDDLHFELKRIALETRSTLNATVIKALSEFVARATKKGAKA